MLLAVQNNCKHSTTMLELYLQIQEAPFLLCTTMHMEIKMLKGDIQLWVKCRFTNFIILRDKRECDYQT